MKPLITVRPRRLQCATTLLARGKNPPGIRAAMHPRWSLRSTVSRCKDNVTLCQSQYTFGGSRDSLCVAPRANSPATALSSRLASPAPHRSRCSDGFVHGLLAVVAVTGGCADPVDPVELEARQVLAIFYRELDGPNWKNNDNWATPAQLATWYGVEVDAEGNVIGLALRDNGVTGELPGELGMLETLENLNLDAQGVITLTGSANSGNSVTGSIPPEFGQLRNLRYLNLRGNRLMGAIPPELGELEKLVSVALSGNQLTGPIPPEIGNLRDLRYLNLQRNRLADALPLEIGNLRKLGDFRLAGNGLRGRLPRELVGLPLQLFTWHSTDLCAPPDDAFQQWLKSIRTNLAGPDCPSG